jgi:hypothetical protein
MANSNARLDTMLRIISLFLTDSLEPKPILFCNFSSVYYHDSNTLGCYIVDNQRFMIICENLAKCRKLQHSANMILRVFDKNGEKVKN